MPDLDTILQTGVPVSKTDLKQYLEGLAPSADDETGVINMGYPIGDVRRYGVFPDGATDWEGDFPARMTAIYANSILPGITIYWPPGEYATSINLDDTYTGSKMYFDNAVFYGILHLLDGVSDVSWLGEVSTYDRLGIASGDSERIRFGVVHMLSDPAKNTSSAGIGGRGVHFVNASDVTFELLDIVDCAAAGPTPPATRSNLAAVWFECQSYSGFRGRIHVRNSQTNGVYINALDIDLDIQVDGYGAQVIDTGIVPLQGISLTQTNVGFGVCIQRSTGKASIRLDQSNASPAADIYPVVFPETGVSSVTASRHKVLDITYLDVTVGDGNRGVCIGTAEDKYTLVNVLFSGAVHIRRRGSDSLVAGYAGLNVLAPPATASHYRRFMAKSLTFSNFGSVLEFRAEGVASTELDNYTDLDIDQISVDSTSGGTISLVGNAATGGRLKGSIRNVHINWTGGSSGTPSILMDGCTNFNLAGGTCRGATQITATALSFINNVNCRAALNQIYNYGHSSFGAIAVGTGNVRCTLGPTELVRAGAITSSIGVRFSGTQTDCIFQGLVLISSFTVGFDDDSPTFTRCTAIQNTAASNTDDTDLTTAMFPAANQLGCTNFAV